MDRKDGLELGEEIMVTAKRWGAFTLAELADDLITAGCCGSITGMSARAREFHRLGVMRYISARLKREKTESGVRSYGALEEGEKAAWRWIGIITRRESRQRYALLKKKARESGREAKIYREYHIERFGEDPDDWCP